MILANKLSAEEIDNEEINMTENINLSEYLDKAYDRFDPDYKIKFEDDDLDLFEKKLQKPTWLQYVRKRSEKDLTEL